MTASTPNPAEYWETRYREKGGWWSGNANVALEREIGGEAPGTALDLGSGEGGDALWLAAEGWSVTAIDISATALAVGAARAESLGLGERIEWVQQDLATWHPSTRPATLELDPALRWYRLDILSRTKGGLLDREGTVEFRASYRFGDQTGSQHELSRFVREGGQWYYVDGD